MTEKIILSNGIEITEEELPILISQQFDELKNLEDNVKASDELATKAKNLAQDAKIKVKLGNKGKAIELLQDAGIGSAEAVEALTDSQKLSFEYQSKLTHITRALFGLAVGNIAVSRTLVRELELRLKNASEDEISELAKVELKNVISQLNAQVDLAEKQDKLLKKQMELATKVSDLDIDFDEQQKKIDKNTTLLTAQKDALISYNKKTSQLEEKIQNTEIYNKKQDKNICENNKNIESLKNEIFTLKKNLSEETLFFEEKCSKIDNDLKENVQNTALNLKSEIEKLNSNVKTNITELQNSINDLNTRIFEMEKTLNKKIWKYAVTIACVISLVLNILQIFSII